MKHRHEIFVILFAGYLLSHTTLAWAQDHSQSVDGPDTGITSSDTEPPAITANYTPEEASSESQGGYRYVSKNFSVTAPTATLAQDVAERAEQARTKLSKAWTGKSFPDLKEPIPLEVTDFSSRTPGGGATSFVFSSQGRPGRWDMKIQGSPNDLASVIDHEVNHTVFAQIFGQPLPRALDEGASSHVEQASERNKMQNLNVTNLKTGLGISMAQLLTMKEYPTDRDQLLAVYAQGSSTVNFLVGKGGGGQAGREKYISFMKEGIANGETREGWEKALEDTYYGGNSSVKLSSVQDEWLDWVRKGSSPKDIQNSDVKLANGTSGQDSNSTLPQAQMASQKQGRVSFEDTDLYRRAVGGAEQPTR